MRVLVTGADGFVGRHMCRHLRASGDEVIEAVGPNAKSGDASSLALDLTRTPSVEAAIETVRPEAIVNLAGFSSVASADRKPAQTWLVNTIGTLNLLAASRDKAPRARVLLVGSGEMYGLLTPGTRAKEDMPLRPLGVYASSKLAAEVAALQFHRRYASPVILARSFNHLGLGQHPSYAVPAFAMQIKAIQAGRSDPVIRVGNLDTVRDFLHVQDTVSAYRLLLLRGTPGSAYNVCSGVGRTIRSLLDEMLEISGIKASISTDPNRSRPAEIPSLTGDPEKLIALGWQTTTPIRTALKEVLEEYSQQSSG
jgi:GDP-4-dehydro-6-deoxy-D-mannose reductase